MLEVKKVLVVSLLVLALTFVCLLPSGEAGEGKDFDKSVLLEARLKQHEESWNSPTSTVYSPEVVVKEGVRYNQASEDDPNIISLLCPTVIPTPLSCGVSICEFSVCAGSICNESFCLISACVGSYCFGSLCLDSGCYGSGCVTSGCSGSNCFESGCHSACSIVSACTGTSICLTTCGGSPYCATNIDPYDKMRP